MINLTHEAKGLDSYLKSREKLAKLNDTASIAILDHNILEEVEHVRKGLKWFEFLCLHFHLPHSAAIEYQNIYKHFFKGSLKPPFHTEFRNRAGMTEDWYLSLVETNNTASSTN